MLKGSLDYGFVTPEEFAEMVGAYLSGMEISKASGLSENQVQLRAKNLRIRLAGSVVMRERNLIEEGAYFVREEFPTFVGWSLASRIGQFVLEPIYMNAMQKFGFLRKVNSFWTAHQNECGEVICGARP